MDSNIERKHFVLSKVSHYVEKKQMIVKSQTSKVKVSKIKLFKKILLLKLFVVEKC